MSCQRYHYKRSTPGPQKLRKTSGNGPNVFHIEVAQNPWKSPGLFRMWSQPSRHSWKPHGVFQTGQGLTGTEPQHKTARWTWHWLGHTLGYRVHIFSWEVYTLNKTQGNLGPRMTRFGEYFQHLFCPFLEFWNHFLKLIPRPLHLAIGTGPPNIFTTQWWSHGSTAHHRFDEKSSLLTCRSSTSDHQPTKATSFLVFPKLEKHQNNIYIYT